MSIEPGTRLGPYAIASPIGAGGMGEVYEAKDTRLDRTVAIKVLPEHLSKDPALRERFEREARAVSSLNHPHICTLHDVRLRQGYGGQVGEDDRIDFLVMEYLEGETLADRLKKGALPFEEAIDYAAQIADALDKAHRAGIVHRDLKPGNIMVTKTGIKLLDFGLAKLRNDGALSSDSEQPTQQKPLTDAGTVMGTVQYMAPEQLEGKDVDARADLFALGAVLYEMLTGRKAFEGESQASLISAIMSIDPPPVSELEARSPPALDRLVKKCLAKDPDDRWHCAHDLMDELHWTTQTAPENPKPASDARVVTVALAGLVVGAIVAWMLVPRPEVSPVVGYFDIALPPDEPLKNTQSVAVSRDGSHIAYTTVRRLYLRARDSAVATAIPSSDDASGPFFSPDGEWLGFDTGSVLHKVSVRGGSPVIVADAKTNIAKGTWGEDGNIIYARGDGAGLFRMSASGGPIDVLASRAEDESYSSAEILPRGDAVLFELRPSTSSGGVGQVVVLSLATGERKVLVERGTNPHYTSSGHLVYGLDATLWAARFDADRLELTGEPFPVTEGVEMSGEGIQFDIADDGTLIYASSGRETRRMVWVDRNGQKTPAAEWADEFVFPRISPDGRSIAASLHPNLANHDIWIYDLGRRTRSRLTTTSHNNAPVWTPDSTRVAFSSIPAGSEDHDIFWKPVDGSSTREPILTARGQQHPTSWHPDGSVLAYETVDAATGRDIWLLPREGEPRPWLATPADEYHAAFSPDGRSVAYVSDETGEPEVYVRSYPKAGSRTLVSSGGGVQPVWSPTGRELFYRSRDGRSMMAVAIRATPELSVGRPDLLFELPMHIGAADGAVAANFDVSRDGERFLMIEVATGAAELHVVLNWLEELKRLDPNMKQ